MSRWTLDIEYRGSRIRAKRDWLGRAVIEVNDTVLARKYLHNYNGVLFDPHTKPIISVDFETRGARIDLALYIRQRWMREEWVLMDGNDVIAATHPSKLPLSRRPRRS